MSTSVPASEDNQDLNAILDVAILDSVIYKFCQNVQNCFQCFIKKNDVFINLPNVAKLFKNLQDVHQKLTKIQPKTLAQALRISGINPSDISVLLVSMGR